MSAEVDTFIQRNEQWPNEMAAMRAVLLDCGLDEAIKWGKPCYRHGTKNIAILQPMSEFLSVMFFKGALLEDPDGILEDQGPNSRSAKRVVITTAADVKRLRKALTKLVDEAIRVEDEGAAVEPPPPLELADELRQRLADDAELRTAFESLTPGRQREYNLHIASAKQSATRHSRIEKVAPKILAGKGFRD